MELFSTEFFAALGAIILIDLVLAGDNAIVIALAARNLPPDLQKKAIFWGAFGAIAVRALMSLAVVWLLKIPGLLAAGGVLLVWIAVRLLAPGSAENGGEPARATGLWTAMKTIVIADAAMGIENVLAVAGAAHGSFLLVVLGLLISVPIVVWASSAVLRLVERFPAIIYAGAILLAWTAANMILGEPLLKAWIEPFAAYTWLAYAAVIAIVVCAGRVRQGRTRAAAVREVSAAAKKPAAAAVEFSYAPALRDGRRLLIPVAQGAVSRAVVEHVARTAPGSGGTTVHLLHVLPRFSRYVGRFLGGKARARFTEQRIAAAIEPSRRLLAARGIEVRTHVCTGTDATGEIIRVAKRIGAEKIVMGSTRKSDLLRFLTGSHTGRVLDRSTIPVEVVLKGEASPWSRIALPAGVAAAIAAAVID